MGDVTPEGEHTMAPIERSSVKPRNWPHGPFARQRPDIGPGVVEVAMRDGDRHYGRGWLPAVVVRAYWHKFRRAHNG